MENASDALKMATAAFIFIGALSLAIFAFTKARQAATAIFSRTNIEYYDTENITITEDRIVGIETVIPTLYSYFKEGYTILFYKGTVDENDKLSGSITPLTLYYTEALPEKLVLSKLLNTNDNRGETTVSGKKYPRAIYGFDSEDEATRQEPWLNDELHAKMFMKSFISNTPDSSKYDMSRKKFSGSPNTLTNNKLTMNFNTGGFLTTIGTNSLAVAHNARFLERTGIYNLTTTARTSSDVDTTVDSSVIEFSNNETIQNDEGVQKRVIQYVYIGNR